MWLAIRYPYAFMRILLQRVTRAEVRVANRVVGQIGVGVLLLVGFGQDESALSLTWMANKVASLRLFSDAEGKMNLGLAEVDGAVLVVSQFTLYGDVSKGRRPSFIDAARPEIAAAQYHQFINLLRERGLRVETGEFGAMMAVELVNDGPVTLWLDK